MGSKHVLCLYVADFESGWQGPAIGTIGISMPHHADALVPGAGGFAARPAGRSGNGCERSGVILKQRFWQQPGETSA
jgi:hypothetical protein